MKQISAARYRLEAARVATGSEDERGVIIRFDGKITGIFVRMEAFYHESFRGFWYLEAGFGACAGSPPPFAQLADGLVWIAGRLEDPTPDLPAHFRDLEAAFDLETEAEAVLAAVHKGF